MILFIYLLYLFIYRERKGGREGDKYWREKHQSAASSMCLEQGLNLQPRQACANLELNRRHFALWDDAQPTEPHLSGWVCYLLDRVSQSQLYWPNLGQIFLCYGGLSHLYSLDLSCILPGCDYNQNHLHTLPRISCGAQMLLDENLYFKAIVLNCKGTSESPLVPSHTRVANINKSTNKRRGCREKGTLVHCWWECRLVRPLWKTVWNFLRKLKMELPFDPAIPLLGLYPKNPETPIQKNLCTPMQCS